MGTAPRGKKPKAVFSLPLNKDGLETLLSRVFWAGCLSPLQQFAALVFQEQQEGGDGKGCLGTLPEETHFMRPREL